MTRRRLALTVVLSIALARPAGAQPYSAHNDAGVIQLQDARSQTVVSIISSVGNIVFEMKVKGHEVLRWPYASIEEFKSWPGLSGIPFLGPWANRLDEPAFYANGKRYAFDMELGNVRGPIPIHGFLATNNQWQVVEVKADGGSAWSTSKLEVFRNPMWMKQFPFAHTIELTHRLSGGALEVEMRIRNLSTDPMPVAIGFHPYFQLTDSARDEWTISVAARTEWLLAQNKVPTGATRPIEELFSDPTAVPLKDYDLDHVFGDLIRDPSGRAVMTVKGKSQALDVVLGPNYRAVVVYAPKAARERQAFICIEPMAGITDAMNLAQKGLYHDLQSIPAGDVWQESFWVRPRGF